MSARSFRIWEIFVASCTTLAALVIPAQLSLSPLLADFSFFDYFLSGILVADIVLRLRRGERSPGWILLDLVAAIPFSVWSLAPAFQLLRLTKIARGIQLMGEIWRRNLHKSLMLRLVLFQYWLVIVTHWFTCGWIALHGVNVAEDGLTGYIHSLYFVVTTLTTVGYGDVTAATNAERLYVIVMMLFGVALYGYVIGNVASILARADPARASHEENLEKVEAFVRYKSLPNGLRKKLSSYYSYVWEQRLGYDESAILNELPPGLRMEVTLHLRRDVIHRVSLFKDAGEEFVREIAQHLMPVVYLPGDAVFKAGDAGESMFFVSRGELDVIAKDGQTTLSQLRDGDYFGEIALVLKQARSASVLAKTFCDVYRLDKEAFERVVRNHPEVALKIEERALERSTRG